MNPLCEQRDGAEITVFISYSHDDAVHRAEVIALAVWLRERGVKVIADDQFGERPPGEGWPIWMQRSIEQADLVLIVCTARYRTLFEKNADARKAEGRGVGWEAAIITQELYENLSNNKKFFPIQRDGDAAAHIPTILKPWDCRHRFPSGCQRILDLIGNPPHTPSRSGMRDIFHLPQSRLADFYADPHHAVAMLHASLHADADADAARVAQGGAQAMLRVVLGMGGVGKTQLVLQYSYAHRAEYAGVWWFCASTAAQLAEDCHLFCLKVGIEPGGAPQRVMRDWLADQARWSRRWLLVFDNAETQAELAEALPHSGAHHVLITSRHMHWHGVPGLRLEVWSADQALVFLRRHLPDSADAELRRLANSLGGLPLALEQACAYLARMRAWPDAVADYARDIERVTSDLPHLPLLMRNDATLAASVQATLSLAFDRLSEAARGLLELCCWLAPEPIPEYLFLDAPALLPPALRALVRDKPRWRETVAELAGFALCKIEAAKAEGADGAQWSAICMHRLTQAAIRARMLLGHGHGHGDGSGSGGDDAGQAAGAMAGQAAASALAKRAGAACVTPLRLLCAAFPKDPQDSQHWPRCQALAAHVKKMQEFHQEGWISDDGLSWLLNQLAWYWRVGPALYGEARCVVEAALAIDRATLGAEHPVTLDSMHNLALLHKAQGDFATASTLYRQTLECRARVLGPEHPDTLITRHNLSITLQSLGLHADARRLQEDILETRSRVLGPEQPPTLDAMLALAESLRLLGEYGPARVLQEQVLLIRGRILGGGHADTLSVRQSLARTLSRQGAHGEAEDLQRQVWQGYCRLHGPEHPHTLSAMHNLAATLQRQGKMIAARDLIDQVVEISVRVLGLRHPDTLASRRWQKSIHASLGPRRAGP